MDERLNILQIAKIVHETNKAFCESIGDNSQVPFESAAQWQQDAATEGVKKHLKALEEGEEYTGEDSHKAWMAVKIADGWVYGPVKDGTAKTHPDLIPYEQLSFNARMKDYLFAAVVMAFYDAVVLEDFDDFDTEIA